MNQLSNAVELDETSKISSTNDDDDDEAGNMACLVAIGRLQPTSMPTSKDLVEVVPPTEFITRQTLDGRFSFVDQRYFNRLKINHPQNFLLRNFLIFIPKKKFFREIRYFIRPFICTCRIFI